MKGTNRFLGAIVVLVIVLAVGVTVSPGWAQKARPPKPPDPPPTLPDPAIAYTIWYHASTAGDRQDLFVANADGTNKKTLISQNGVHCTLPDWSPDGKKLVFVDDASGSWAINIINVDGTGQQRIFSLYDSVGSPAWSPVPLGDEQNKQYKIAFYDKGLNPDGSRRANNDIFLINVDGSGFQQLTDTPEINECIFAPTIAWSNDGRFLAIPMYDHVLIYQVDWNGEKFVATSCGTILNDLGIEISDIDWANTQYKLVVEGGWFDLWIADLTLFPDPEAPSVIVSRLFQLTNTPDIREEGPSWSPDDLQIVYDRGGIWVINVDGTGAHEIIPPVRRADLDHPKWRRNL